MKYDFITLGGTTRDISFFTNQGILIKNPNHKDVLRKELLAFEYGAKIKVDNFHYAYGGGSANTAVCLSNFGYKTTCLTTTGDDENGRKIIENLKNRGVNSKLVKTIKNEESGSSFILVDPSGERIIFSQRGSNHRLKIDNQDLKEFKKTKNVYIASLAGDWYNNLRKVFTVSHDNGQKVFWNPGMTQLLSGPKKIESFVNKVTVLAINKDEALQLIHDTDIFKEKGQKYFDNTNNLVKHIHKLGPKIAVITLGSKGVIVYDGEKIYRRKIIREKKRVDTTGIGDAFNSSFAAGYVSSNGDIDKALDLALKNAASKVEHLGAQNGLITENLVK
ncbi:MAG: carbohydrate kinase family protein [Patescibacteria group bacterium]|jgi:ribokinase|nr:carbohydrate kinase family protein [Patescibacteria group bacterium]